MALDEDEDEEDDQEEDLVSESEDEEGAFDADEAADEDGNLGDDEDADGGVDDAYIKRLERESRRLKVLCYCKCPWLPWSCCLSTCTLGEARCNLSHVLRLLVGLRLSLCDSKCLWLGQTAH